MRTIFNTYATERLLIPYARDMETGAIVRLPNDRLCGPQDVHYDAEKHKGHLQCPECDAKIHFNTGCPSRGGDNLSGAASHFSTNRGQEHDVNCGIRQKQLQREESEREPYDPTKGFVINLNSFVRQNTFQDIFHHAHDGGIYRHEGDGKTRLNDELKAQLKGMQRVAVDSVQDLVDFLKSKPVSRIRQSVVSHRGRIYPWHEFLIFKNHGQQVANDNRDQRIKDFVARIKPGEEIPCLIEIKLDKGINPSYPYKIMSVKPKGVFNGVNESTREPKFIMPRIYIENTRLNYHFSREGYYLILGYARIGEDKKNRSRNQPVFLNIRVDDARQIEYANLMDIAAENRRRHPKKPDRDSPLIQPA